MNFEYLIIYSSALFVFMIWGAVALVKTLDSTIGITYCFSCDKKVKRAARDYLRMIKRPKKRSKR